MMMNFSDTCYPLNVQCGGSAWRGADLTLQFQRQPRPQRTYFRHLLADYLNRDGHKGLTAAELELWATLNQVLRQVAMSFLGLRQGKVRHNQVDIGGTQIVLPRLDAAFRYYVQEFPALPVEMREVGVGELLKQIDSAQQNHELLIELLLLYVQSRNPALEPVRQLFAAEEERLQQHCDYRGQLLRLDTDIPAFDDGFRDRPTTLLARLLEPLQRGASLREQLELLRELWADILPEELLARISSAFEQYEREGWRPDFPGEPELEPFNAMVFGDAEYANFTVDTDWMPRTVLMAKSTYVWLAQLSQKYSRDIRTLDQIPDEELNELASQGFSSLWLIGLWKRSKASLKIKQLYGQVQVAASAYAIDEYVVADDLGGQGALNQLKDRCRRRGIDLACDVVTNHTGIESAWLRDHPDWFIQLPYPPYPGYRFTGPDLSEDPNYSIQIEDGYYDHSEAAVVCRYQHRHSGETRFIYHGNDGTHLPWNDTAQLNYLVPQVREAMIQLIIRVARDFRIIRFDAAMTLAKRHFQRLWFPLPGGGSGVPSRQDHALSHEQFNHYFSIEFWRELVDRVRAEVPDTLLIAEAFWLMEGYFVRTLGMHRVYNSAFMNMLKREENAKYRETLKNILEFDPAILQRFVNFMSNPDEKPAIEQFGDGDKYFCVATMLATMPGLPMFGHGQLEGFTEKYGMEYLAPRYQEQPNQALQERHRRELFPLLRKRALFSGASSFQLYNFLSVYGVEEDVFVYSNRLEERTVLILCNNSNKHISGRIGAPVYMADKDGISFQHACHIDLHQEFVLMKDLSTGQQYLQPAWLLKDGGEFQLPPYAHRVVTEFTALYDRDGRWQQVWQRFGDSPRPNYYLERDLLLLDGSLAKVNTLFGLTAEQLVPETIAPLVDELAEIYAGPFSEMSPAWQIQILVRQLFAEENLEEASFELLANCLERFDITQKRDCFRLFDRLFNDRFLRRLTAAHYYDYRDWFSQERFTTLQLLPLQFIISRQARQGLDYAYIAKVIQRLQQVVVLAEESGFCCDRLVASLDPTESPDLPLVASDKDGKNILFVASEATPFAKSGGLADVIGSLPVALRELGHDVRVMIPAYQIAEDRFPLVKTEYSLEITLQGVARRASLKEAVYDGVPYYFIDTPEFFDRPALYGTTDGDYGDNALRYGFFCRAVLEAVKLLDFRPDVLHLHDWQSSLLPALLKTSYRDQAFFARTKTLLTIHNLGYQGMFSLGVLPQLELPYELGRPDAFEYYGGLSFLKGGIVYADLINTVSPTYCLEIQGQQQGHGFDGILRSRSRDLYGIINGLDERIWDPEHDPALAYPFSHDNLSGKLRCKQALQQDLGLQVAPDIPLIAVVSRLDRQKGITLIEEIWPQLMQREVQFVLLGSGNNEQMRFWQRQQGQNVEQVSINLTFNERLSHQLYSAADLLLVPSRYEPCGLTQMIASRYGALPLVRKTGGLADTVSDIAVDPEQGNGFVFKDSDSTQLLATIDRALELYAQPDQWQAVVQRGMARDFSWRNSAWQYEKLYAQLTADSVTVASVEASDD